MSLFDVTGRIALVTGSSRGLGWAMARGLGEAGATVILNGRDAERLDAAAEELRDEGLDVHARRFDVTHEDAVAAALADIRDALGSVDILINNAGVTRRSMLEDLETKDFVAVQNVHVTGAFIVSKYVVADMIERKRGKIINICSLTSEAGRPGIGAYMSAKGGLRNLTRAMALDWARHNVQVNGIGPGYFKTELTRPLVDDAEFEAWLEERTPAGRWGEPEDLVGAAVFLASDASNFVNGHILYVDGGILASL